MKEKILKLIFACAAGGAAVAIGFFIILLVPIDPPPESRASFADWEATQKRQESHSAVEATEGKP